MPNLKIAQFPGGFHLQHGAFRGGGGMSGRGPLILVVARLASSLLVVACVSGRDAHAGAAMAVLPVAAGTAYLSIEGIPPETEAAAAADGEWILYLDGHFDPGAAERLAGFIAQQEIRRASVYFNSPGGSLVVAMDIGRLLREHQFHTRVGSRAADPHSPGAGVCYSACPFAYAGGVRRFLDSGAVIGIHRVANRVPVPDEHAFDQVVSGQATRYLSDMGINHHLFRMMELVPHEEIRLLTYQEAQQLKLVSD